MKIYIKNMVCPRCIMVTETIFTTLGYTIKHVKLGEVCIKETLSFDEIEELKIKLQAIGLELLDDRRNKVVTQIKSLLIDLVQQNDANLQTSLSVYISESIGQDYHSLTQLFSHMESTTIEQYFILLKIERVKELLVYNELSLKEIAFTLNYSSVAHLSAQFKKVTGLTPTHFKGLGNARRKLIDSL